MEALVKAAAERRRYVRTAVSFDVFSMNTDRLIGRAINLSLGGMFIEAENPLKPGTKLLLEFTLHDQEAITAYCDVRWFRSSLDSTLGQSGMAVQFVGIYEYSRRKLQERIIEYLRKINSDDYSLADFMDVPDRDLFKKTDLFWQYGEDMLSKGFVKYRIPLVSCSQNRVQVEDEITGKPRGMIMMGSSNYLGLTTHRKVIEASKKALERYGAGAGGAALLAGTYGIHKELETRLAKLVGCQDAVIFQTGYGTNMGCISALVRRHDIAIIDRLCHASILDGCKLSNGLFKTFRHSALEDLRQQLENSNDRYAGKLVIVDGVYSVGGDIAPLGEIVKIANDYEAKVMVDEAHAIGVIGEKGRGTTSCFNLEGKVHLVMGSLGKSLGGMGGFVASSEEVIRYLRYYARPYFFSTYLPPNVAAAVLAAIDVMEDEPELIKRLWTNIKYVKENLKNLGFDIGNSESAIIPVIIGDELTLRKVSKEVYEEGLYLNAIPYPAVPKGQECLRLRLMATHTREDLDKALEVLEKVGRRYSILP